MHYHFIGVGGIGVGMLASLVLSKGHSVSGSDIVENEMTRSLCAQGARITIGHRPEALAGADCLVFSSAIRADNPELVAARQQGIRVLKRAQLLAELMEYQLSITVAGAHGKTTTTSMIANLLIRADRHPTVALGGVFKNGSYQAYLGDGQYFVAEVDESDGSFLFFHPRFSVITNMDREHLDYYGDWDRIRATFLQYMAQTQPQGKLIVCGDDVALRQLAIESGRPLMTYGFSDDNDVRAGNVRFQGCSSRFDYSTVDGQAGNLQLLLPGRHNILNALACFCVGQCLNLDLDIMAESFRFFQGVDRRFQIKGRVNGIVVVDDYGHHPTEILATFQAAQALDKKRMLVVFQPHRYSRTKALEEEFVKCLSQCDYLIITDIYAASEKPIENVSAKKLFDRIRPASNQKIFYLKKGAILEHLLKNAQSGDLILTLGAGDIYRVGEEFLAALSSSPASPYAQGKNT